ncbi:hypothetical protein BD410DRAFT_796228, partial [Rickenella mellea]
MNALIRQFALSPEPKNRMRKSPKYQDINRGSAGASTPWDVRQVRASSESLSTTYTPGISPQKSESSDTIDVCAG